MSIVEVINCEVKDDLDVIRIYTVPDGKIRILKSHGYRATHLYELLEKENRSLRWLHELYKR